MKDFDIAEVMETLYEIDEQGILIDEKLSNLKKEYDKKLLERLKNSEKEFHKKAREDAKKKTSEIMLDIVKREEVIKKETQTEIDRLESILSNHKNELIKKVFDHVFLKEDFYE